MRLSAIRSLLPSSRRGQRGQTLVIFGLAFVFLMGIVGLATDSAFAYFRSISVERAAAAAALAGVPYMPKYFAPVASKQDATDRAIAEAARNGFVNGVGSVTVTAAPATDDPKALSVTISAPTPTFFLNALGVGSFPVVRTAIAGYKPPIALGQPGTKIGSTVSELGAAGNFYFPRYKAWNLQRSEGDAFTPNPDENATGGSGGSISSDVHQFSKVNGIESPDVDCTSGAFKMPCRGGYNWRIVVPAGQNAEIQVYNAANAPDYGAKKNNCENQKNLPTCNSNAGYHFHEDDMGAPCNQSGPVCTQGSYNATGYTLLDVPNVFLRNQDVVLSQTIVYPIDATNYDGALGATGKGSTAVPSYINVKDQSVVTQYYDSSGNPCNMKIYHAWMDVANYSGSQVGACTTGDNIGNGITAKTLVKRTAGLCNTPCSYNGTANLGPGTYRLRVDALNFDGSFSSTGNPFQGRSSKGYAVQVVDATTKLGSDCVGCTVSGWADMCVYTPISAGTGVVPLFELTKDYQGATIDVDIFDVGDASNDVKLAILDPTGAVASQPSGTLPVTNNGINRAGGPQHTPPQSPAPQPLGAVNKGTFAANQAGYVAALGSSPQYQGSWIRISIPIPSTYDPQPYPNDFWKLQYYTAGGANDTFTFAVSARGGPVHLLK